MWETIKKYAGYFVGGIIFLVSIVAVLGRRKEVVKEDSQDEKEVKEVVVKANAQHAQIVVEQNKAIEVVTAPIAKTESADMDTAIETWKNT